MKERAPIVLMSADKINYVVILGVGGRLRITTVKNDSNCMDAICIVAERDNLKNILRGGELADKNAKKISFIRTKRRIKVETTEGGKVISMFIRKKEFGKLGRSFF